MKRKEAIIAGLDIGTSKICCLIAENDEEQAKILGIGTAPSLGFKRGTMVNFDQAVESIEAAVVEAETMAGVDIDTVIAGIGGSVRGTNSHGVVAIKGKEINKQDIDRVIEAATAVAIPPDREIIHILVQEYLVDDQGEINNPIGICGVRLEAKVHIITALASAAHNIIRCANHCGLKIQNLVSSPLASANTVLGSDEKKLGVALVDIGGGTSEIIIYADGHVVHSSTITIGGSNISNDIAVGLRTPIAEADRIKESFGSARADVVHKDETIEIPSVGGREPRLISRRILCDIIEPRVEEMLSLIYKEIIDSGFEDEINSGIVFTGGTAKLEGISEMAEDICGCPVRLGNPQISIDFGEMIRNPIYSTALGLIFNRAGDRIGGKSGNMIRVDKGQDGFYLKMRNKMSGFIKEFF